MTRGEGTQELHQSGNTWTLLERHVISGKWNDDHVAPHFCLRHFHLRTLGRELPLQASNLPLYSP